MVYKQDVKNVDTIYFQKKDIKEKKGEIMTLEELMDAANQLSIEDLRELAMFCNDLADSLEGE